MERLARITLIVVALLILAAATPALAAAAPALAAAPAGTSQSQSEAPTVEALSWLTGCWARDGQELGTGETWTTPAGGTLLGTSRTVKDGEMSFYEFMMIRPAGDGLEFVAWPAGQGESAFPMVELDEGRVVFENPEHDFPQRIIYHLREDVRLDARIEGEQNGETLGVDFPFRREECR